MAALDAKLEKLVTSGALVWMPAHKGAGAIGHAEKSSNTPLTAVDWRANRLADYLARKAAKSTAISAAQRKLLNSAAALAKFSATKLGIATWKANNCERTEVSADGSTR